MAKSSLHLYLLLSRLRHLKSYQSKILLVAFLGTHIPLLALIVYFLLSTSTFELTGRVLITTLFATLGGTGLTLCALHNLLAPVVLTSQALREYRNERKLPDLPTGFTDQVGTLMADALLTIKKLEELIEHVSSYDDLTGLPNRTLFQNRLQQALSQSPFKDKPLTVILVGLDGFKNINSTLGHSAGDLLLKQATQRLSNCLGETDILSRFGGDEFAIIQSDLTSSDSAIALSKKILNTLSKPFLLKGQQVYISASIGISIYPFDNTNVNQLLQNADNALYQAKQKGRNNYQFYSAQMNAKLQERLNLERELHKALKRGELLLHYQPRVDLHSGRMIAVEALLRWQSSTLGLISPAKFIPIAEENGLIVPIGEWVLRHACIQNQIWQMSGLPPLRMAVNLSARQFEQQNLVELVTEVLEETGLEANYLELEITESLVMNDVQQSIAILKQLHERGIALALDDFGTGYSSLNYLKRFPIDTLKIDQSFVRHITSDPNDAAVIRAIIALGSSLQLNITAEGVETQEQLDYLIVHRCDEVQGYYFSRPVPADSVRTLLEKDQNFLKLSTAVG
jgi:diguanylate cyclase (GGDEF)-like protein